MFQNFYSYFTVSKKKKKKKMLFPILYLSQGTESFFLSVKLQKTF